jgi:hypothetical protein
MIPLALVLMLAAKKAVSFVLLGQGHYQPPQMRSQRLVQPVAPPHVRCANKLPHLLPQQSRALSPAQCVAAQHLRHRLLQQIRRLLRRNDLLSLPALFQSPLAWLHQTRLRNRKS